MAGLEGIDASSMDLVDALGARFVYDVDDHIAKPVLRHTDFAPVAILRDGERVIEKVRFGLPMQQGRIITNARDDKVLVAPGWKALFGKSHGLVAVSYVVERNDAGEAFRIQRRDGKPIVVPALVARRHYRFASTGNEYDDLGHVQVTADANDFVATVHDRFVVELASKADRDLWMTPGTSKEDLVDLLKRAPNDRYEMVPIDADVWTKRDAASVRPRGPAVHWAG